MAAKKSSSIKPPVIDLEANKPANNHKESKERVKTEQSYSSEKKPTVAAKTKFSAFLNKQTLFSTIFATIGGAVLGLGAAFMLAFFGFWPQKAPPANLLNSPAEISALGARVSANEQVLTSNKQQVSELVTNEQISQEMLKKLQQTSNKNSDNLSAISEKLAILEVNSLRKQDLPAPIDLAPINKNLQILSDKIATIDAGANSADASAIVNSITLLREQSDLLNNEIIGLKTNLEQNAQTIKSLKTEQQNVLEQNDKLVEQLAIINQKSLNGAGSNQLATTLKTLEGAIDEGKPFIAEIATLKTMDKDIKIPEVLQNASANGFMKPSELAQNFIAKVPQLLALKPIDESASWSDRLTQRTLSLLAIRPIDGQGEGNIETIIGNIEQSLTSNDFIKASELIKKLPKEMQVIISDEAKEITNIAKAQQFIINLKTQG